MGNGIEMDEKWCKAGKKRVSSREKKLYYFCVCTCMRRRRKAASIRSECHSYNRHTGTLYIMPNAEQRATR